MSVSTEWLLLGSGWQGAAALGSRHGGLASLTPVQTDHPPLLPLTQLQ